MTYDHNVLFENTVELVIISEFKGEKNENIFILIN